MEEIIIKVDTERKICIGAETPESINPLEAAIILQMASMRFLSQMKAVDEKPPKKIITPAKNIVTPGGNNGQRQ